MGVSDKIESFITELLKNEEDEWLELRRNELATFFNCVPSQINYVISTRFNPEHGFVVESRRGGGGYLRIRRISENGGSPFSRVISEIGNSLSFPDAKAYLSYLVQVNALDRQLAGVMLAGVSDNSLSLPQPDKDRVRASVMKNMLASAQQ